MSNKKVILISIDGMRPDGFEACGNPFVEELKRISAYTLNGSSMIPSATLPCHMSMFHSVTPQRHGIVTNEYSFPIHAFPGLFEQLHNAGKTTAMYYGWEPLRDISRPRSLTYSQYIWAYAADHTDGMLTDCAIAQIKATQPDFIFLYMVETDEKGGHDNGWMTPEYLSYVSAALDNVKRVLEAVDENYTVIVTADHGGHDRTHGTEMPEDMTIPLFFIGEQFEPGKVLENVSLLNLAPTIADIMQVPCVREWDGTSLIK